MTLALIGILVLFLLAAGYVMLRERRHRLHPYLSAHDKSLVHVQWHEIEQRMKKGGTTNFRQAVIDGDKLVDYCLKQLKVKGDTMGERLRGAQPKFSDYDGLWKAHKMRNQVVHEVNKEVLSFETKSAIARFRQALADLGAL